MIKPPVVSEAEWREQRVALLAEEKELTKHRDRVNAKRRRLPMVKVTKEYLFESPTGKRSLEDLFEGKHQLVVYHFMFDPSWDEGCGSCTGFVDALGDLSMLVERDTAFTLISRAPLPKLLAYAVKRGWDRPWVSSFENDFNYDYHVTLDEKVAPIEHNYVRDKDLKGANGLQGENHGMSVFFRDGDEVYHTYSTYSRGTENITNTYEMLDITPYGRQEDFEDSPEGWPQKPTYG